MTSAGTLISDLDGKAPSGGGGDDDLVRQIMADINGGGGGGGGMGPPPPQLNSYKIQQPNANTTYNTAVDPAVPTAHMIGSQHPNPADFATMMTSNGQGMGGGTPYVSMGQQQQSQQQQQYLQPAQQQPVQDKFNWKALIFEQLRQPILVALIVFVLSLPAVNVLFQHYAPSLLRSGGDLNNLGLLARATLAGAFFWIFQNVIAPLMV